MSRRRHLANLESLLAVCALASAACVTAAGSASAASTGNFARGHTASAAQAGLTTRVTAKSSVSPDPAHVAIKSSTISGLGPVLVNHNGDVLYVFEPDKQNNVTCKKACAIVWPPVVAKDGRKPVAEGDVKQSMLGTVPNPNGPGRVVTYNGWPLYTYAADTKAGQANGQALNINGGLWYVISPAGKVIRNKH